ncbi:HD domain-containing protein [Xanthomonas euroxanthea]|uniref:HD domain-containing protein n=1 Tax=Xanthomonas euroxanthea TaxID=2259622 RepID=UPI00160E23F3|nr:HD domain-containing protein [Xanthomonas euroxanthea]MBB5766712.1 hypothetical protein [Xanthomonas euroxanthea]
MSTLDWAPGNHVFEFHSKDIGNAFHEPLFKRIIGTKAFKRLSNIHFLGGIDYLVPAQSRSFRRHNRFNHTLAVASLAKRYAEKTCLDRKDSLKLVVAALLHDIGHAPLSHSLESVFRSLYGVDHHKVGREIILGINPLGFEIASILDDFDIDAQELVDLIEGDKVISGADIFSRAINVDTAEGIIRSSMYMACHVPLSPVSVIDALARLDESSSALLDEFWLQKGRVYKSLIQSSAGALADIICVAYMKENLTSFSADQYWDTGLVFKRCHAGLFVDLDGFRRDGVVPDYAMPYVESSRISKRTFVIDSAVELREPGDLDLRYRQVRREAKISTSGFRRTGRSWSAVYPVGEGILE